MLWLEELQCSIYQLKNGKLPRWSHFWSGLEEKDSFFLKIRSFYPFDDAHITKYAEPFVGGGAVLFDILSKYEIEEVYISDINLELINAYHILRDDVDSLIAYLLSVQDEYLKLDMEHRKALKTSNTCQRATFATTSSKMFVILIGLLKKHCTSIWQWIRWWPLFTTKG